MDSSPTGTNRKEKREQRRQEYVKEKAQQEVEGSGGRKQAKSAVLAKRGRIEGSTEETGNRGPRNTSSNDDDDNPNLLDDEENWDASFEDLGLCTELCNACSGAGWKVPTRIQVATIPVAISGKDLVGVAQTGSGKTGAYALPLVQNLLNVQERTRRVPFLSILVLVPTRELAMQVSEQFTMLGKQIGLTVAALIGGQDMVAQACELSKRPHVIVGTPGRVKDHITNTRGFRLHKLAHLVLDEADKMLEMDYEREIDAILEHIPVQRQTFLFSATLSAKIDRLQKASLRDPVMLQVHRTNSTVATLRQFYVFVPFAQMMAYLHMYLTQETAGNHILIFCASGHLVHRLTLTLRVLGHRALPLMGKMTQENRNVALHKFKEGKVRVLVCTDVAQRGLDVPHTDVVVNYSLPLSIKDYIHRVGRTARAGSSGKAVNIVSQYDVPQLQSIEHQLGAPFEELRLVEHPDVMQRVEDAEQEALKEMREHQQDDKLGKEQQRHTGGGQHGPKRSSNRGGGGAGGGGGGAQQMGMRDELHGTKDFGVLRVRRENEEAFGMTKSKQFGALRKIKRDKRK